MNTPEIFFYEAFKEEVPALKRHLDPTWKVTFTAQTIQETGHTAPPAAIISIRTQSLVPPSWAASLRCVQTRSTGYDQLVKFLRASPGFPCGSLPKYCGRAVAEHAAMLWLALLRKLPSQIEQFDGFHRDGLTGREAHQKTILVAGAGDIGFYVAEIARGLGMNVIAADPVQRHAHLRYLPLDEGIRSADIIVCAMNLTGENLGLLGYETLRHARPGCIFVNVSRGEVSPAGELLRLLEEGILGGVGLDVFDDEPRLANAMRHGSLEIETISRLRSRNDVILTPHNAFNTIESTERKSVEAARELAHFIAHGRFVTPVVV